MFLFRGTEPALSRVGGITIPRSRHAVGSSSYEMHDGQNHSKATPEVTGLRLLQVSRFGAPLC